MYCLDANKKFVCEGIMDIRVFQIGLCTACYMNAPFHYRLHHLDVGYCRLSLDGDYVMPMGGR